MPRDRARAARTTAPLAALFPVALAPAAGAHDKSSVFARAYDAVVGSLHDRRPPVAFKVQAATEAASTGKLAAIAASAAAIGGGGRRRQDAVPPAHHPAAAHARPVAQRATPAPPTAPAPGRKLVARDRRQAARRRARATSSPRARRRAPSSHRPPPRRPRSRRRPRRRPRGKPGAVAGQQRIRIGVRRLSSKKSGGCGIARVYRRFAVRGAPTLTRVPR
jgi:hypothetical protein